MGEKRRGRDKGCQSMLGIFPPSLELPPQEGHTLGTGKQVFLVLQPPFPSTTSLREEPGT